MDFKNYGRKYRLSARDAEGNDYEKEFWALNDTGALMEAVATVQNAGGVDNWLLARIDAHGWNLRTVAEANDRNGL